MKNNLLLAFILVFGPASFAVVHHVSAEETVNVANKTCPVTGEAIPEGEAQTVEYKGKTYNLCCGMCKKDFDKDPDKYTKIAEDEVKGQVKD